MSFPIKQLPVELQIPIYEFCWEDLDAISQVDNERRFCAQHAALGLLKHHIGALFSSCLPVNFDWKSYVKTVFYHHDLDKLPFTHIAKLKGVVLEFFTAIYRNELWKNVDNPDKIPALCQWMGQETVNFDAADFKDKLQEKYINFQKNPSFKMGNFTRYNPRTYVVNLTAPLESLIGPISMGSKTRPPLLVDFLYQLQQPSVPLDKALSAVTFAPRSLEVIYVNNELLAFQRMYSSKIFQKALLWIIETSLLDPSMPRQGLSRLDAETKEAPFAAFFAASPISSLFLQRLKIHPQMKPFLASRDFPLKILLNNKNVSNAVLYEYIQLYWETVPAQKRQPILHSKTHNLDLASEKDLCQIIQFLKGYIQIGGDINEYYTFEPYGPDSTCWMFMARQTSNPIVFREHLDALKSQFPQLDLTRQTRKGRTIEDVLIKRCQKRIVEIAHRSIVPIDRQDNITIHLKELESCKAEITSLTQLFLVCLKPSVNPVCAMPLSEGDYETQSDADSNAIPAEKSILTTPLAQIFSWPWLPLDFIQKLRSHPHIGAFLVPVGLPSPIIPLLANPSVPLEECIVYFQHFEKAGGKIDERSFASLDESLCSPLHIRFSFYDSKTIDLETLRQFLALYQKLGGDINNQDNEWNCTPFHVIASKLDPQWHKDVFKIFQSCGAHLDLQDLVSKPIFDISSNEFDKIQRYSWWYAPFDESDDSDMSDW